VRSASGVQDESAATRCDRQASSFGCTCISGVSVNKYPHFVGRGDGICRQDSGSGLGIYPDVDPLENFIPLADPMYQCGFVENV